MGTIAEPLGMSITEAAYGVYQVVNENMITATRVHLSEHGEDPRALEQLRAVGPAEPAGEAEEQGGAVEVDPAGPAGGGHHPVRHVEPRSDPSAGGGQSHQRSWARTPRAIRPSCTWLVPSTIVSCLASR